MIRFFKYGRSLSALSAFVGVGLIMAIPVVNTTSELDSQDRYFLWAVVGVSVAALFTALFAERGTPSTENESLSRFCVLDGLVVLSFLYLFFNYHLLSPVNVSAKWIQTVYLFILYGALRIILPAYKQMERFLLAAIMVCGAIESTLGIMQLLGFRASHHHLFAFTGTFMNTGPYGGFLAVTMSVSLGFMCKGYQKFQRQGRLIKQFPLTVLKSSHFALYLLSVFSFCTAFITFFAALSRASILGLFISASVMAVTQTCTKQWFSNFFSSHRKLNMVAAAAIAVLILSGIGATYYLKKESVHGRFIIWKISCNAITNRPVMGCGFGSFFGEYAAASAEYFTEKPSSPAIPMADVPEYGFNEYLQTGVETGVAGLLLLLSILSLTLCKLLRAKSLFAYGLIVILVFAFFSYPFSQLPFLIMTVLFVSSGAKSRRVTEKQRSMTATEYTFGQRVPVVVLTVLFIVVSGGWAGIYVRKIEATDAWKQSKMLYRTQQYDDTRLECAELYPLLKDNPRFLFEYGHALNKTERFAQSNAILKEGAQLSCDPMFYNVMGNNHKGLGEVERAEEAYRYAFSILPNRLYPLYLLMKLYAETDQLEKALEAAQKVIDFTPKIDSPAVREIKQEAIDFLQ